MTVIVDSQNSAVILADSKKNYVAALKGTVIINSNGTGNSTVNLSFNQANGFTGNFTNGNLTIDLQNANATQSGKLTNGDWQRLDGAVGNVTVLQNETTNINNALNLTNGNVTALQNLTSSLNQTLTNHTGNFTNPHNVTKSQIGLGNVSDIAPLDLPISNATQAALNAKLDANQKGAANGVAELVNGTVPIAQLPSYVDDVIESANFSALPVTGEAGKIYVTLDDNLTYRWSGSAYAEISKSLALGETSATAYRGDRGAIAYNHSQTTHDKAFVGLANVDNTSDLDKPISNATQSALNTKANANLTINGYPLTGNVTILASDINLSGYVPANRTINGVNLSANVTLTTANISDSTNKRYVNETQLANINNISNTSIHSSLTNLIWTTSGHTGNISSMPAFDGTGQPTLLNQSGTGSVALTNGAFLSNANLTTPILGTPQSGNLTNCNGIATNLTAGNVSFLNFSGNTTSITGVLNATNGGTGLTTLSALAVEIGKLLYPVGAIYHSDVATDPATLLGFGTWTLHGVGRVTVCIDTAQTEFDTLGETGGAKTHTLTTGQIPSGILGVNSTNAGFSQELNGLTAGGAFGWIGRNSTAGQAHNNLQPYIVVYRWVRTA